MSRIPEEKREPGGRGGELTCEKGGLLLPAGAAKDTETAASATEMGEFKFE